MSYRANRALLAVLLLTCCAAPAGAAPAAAPLTGLRQSQDVPDQREKQWEQASPAERLEGSFAMSLSGGISLGAYDAGRNWVLLQHLKRLRADPGRYGPPPLASVSGASAGALNTLITALSWCAVGELGAPGDRLLDNQYYQLWTSLDFEALLPANEDKTGFDPARYQDAPDARHQDGLLARSSATAATVDRLRRWVASPAFRPGCRVPIGMAVSRADALERKVFGGNLDYSLPDQTLYFVADLVVDAGGWARFLARPVHQAERDYARRAYEFRFDGPNLVLPGTARDGSAPLDFEQIIDVALASSAFPVAFGRVFIPHCVAASRPNQAADPACPQPGSGARLVVERLPFVDGGVFDNVPLGLALVLSPRSLPSFDYRALLRMRQDDLFYPAATAAELEDQIARMRVLYVDPNIRRGSIIRAPDTERSVCAPADKDAAGDCPYAGAAGYGLMDQLGFIGGALSVIENVNRAQVLRGLCGGHDPSVDGELGNCSNFAMVLTRHRPITGEMLGHFGAFLDQRFSRYDYFVGVYDALYALAMERQGNQAGRGRRSARTTVGAAEITEEGRKLGLLGQPGWQSVLAVGEEIEPPSAGGDRDAIALMAVRDALHAAAYSPPTGDTHAGYVETTRFQRFMHNLGAFPPFTAEKGDDTWLGAALEDPRRWYAGMTPIATSRLLWLEDRRVWLTERGLPHDPESTGLPYAARKAVAWADILGRELAPKPGLDLCPSHNPRFVPGCLLPYQASAELIEGGVSLNWMGVYQLNHMNRVEFPFGASLHGERRASQSQATFGIQFRHARSAAVAFGLGTQFGYDLDPSGRRERSAFGGALFADYLGKFRFQLGYRDAPWGSGWMLSVGLNDLGSLFRRYSKAEVAVD